MPLEKIFKGDTAVLEAWCFEEDGETPAKVTSVSWGYLLPGGASPTTPSIPVQPATVSPTAGTALVNMTGTYEYVIADLNGTLESIPSASASVTVTNQRVDVTYGAAAGGVTSRRLYRRKSPSTSYHLIATLGTGASSYTDSLIEDDPLALTPAFNPSDNYARLYLSDTSTVGLHRAVATFTRADGTLKSVRVTYTVEDPLEIPTLISDELGQTLDLAWMYFEDCFDSELGGPWLRDVTLANFDREKLERFTSGALYLINVTPPEASYDETSFPYAGARPLFAKGIEIEAIKHLMRSYVEQPNVVGSGQISYFDRRDYFQRWQTILEMEEETFKVWLALFKRGQYNFGATKTLVDIKAGRRHMLNPNYRLRYPYYPYF